MNNDVLELYTNILKLQRQIINLQLINNKITVFVEDIEKLEKLKSKRNALLHELNKKGFRVNFINVELELL